jgi:formylglycine-generating enzyme required for sulfatase activity
MAVLKMAFNKIGRRCSGIQKSSINIPRSGKRPAGGSLLIPEMVNIPGGKFMMGSLACPTEQPIRKIKVSSFALAKYEVTNAQYRVFLKATGKQNDTIAKFVDLTDRTINLIEGMNIKGMSYSNGKLIISDVSSETTKAIRSIPSEDRQKILVVIKQFLEARISAKILTNNKYDKHPVVNVFWHEAVEYCEWLSGEKGKNFRLPTEAEWEYAARGEMGYKYPWKTECEETELKNKARFMTVETAPVDAHPEGASPFGVHDMAGNAYELTADYFSENYDDRDLIDPKGPESGKAMSIRGCSFIEFDAKSLRASCRNSIPFGYTDDRIGFRIVRELNRFEKFKVNLRTIYDDVMSIVSRG